MSLTPYSGTTREIYKCPYGADGETEGQMAMQFSYHHIFKPKPSNFRDFPLFLLCGSPKCDDAGDRLSSAGSVEGKPPCKGLIWSTATEGWGVRLSKAEEVCDVSRLQTPHLHSAESHTLYPGLDLRGSEGIQSSGLWLSGSMSLGVKAFIWSWNNLSGSVCSAPADSPLNCLLHQE